jgi:uncharacterized protein
MIEEIKKLRREGLSFRKIAAELDSTVGKVQYQWTKYMKQEELKKTHPPRTNPETIVSRLTLKHYAGTTDHLTAWLISNHKVFVFWKLSEDKKDLITQYYGKHFSDYEMMIRFYDVTHVLFNGSNANGIQEVKIGHEQEQLVYDLIQSNRCYVVELGVKITHHQFLPLLRSSSLHVPRTGINQVGDLEKELANYTIENDQAPNWIEHVSTYSYYQNSLTNEKRQNR